MKSYFTRCIALLEYTIILLIATVALFPIFWLILSAFKTRLDVFTLKFFFRPILDNFHQVLLEPHYFIKHLINSFLISGTATLVGVGISLPASYGFSRFPIRGKNNMLFWIISLQFIPPVVFLIPFYVIFRQAKLLDTHLSLIVSYLLITIPFSIWILKTHIDAIPRETEEAAMVDGASHFIVLWHIVVPIAKPAIIVAIILSLILTLNEFLFAFVLTKINAVTMPVALMQLETNVGVQWEDMAATGVLMMVPVMIFAYIIQKDLIKGLTLGAIK